MCYRITQCAKIQKLLKDGLMNKLLIVIFCALLAGCFGPAKFDASSEATIKESTQKIVSSLTGEELEEFKKAMMYFTIGGESGLGSIIGAVFSGNSSGATTEVMLAANLKSIDGLTGEQILKKYRTNLVDDRIKREKQTKEKEKINRLEQEAKELLKNRKFEEAITKYKAMSDIPSGMEVAEIGIESTTREMNDFTEKMNYMDNIVITEFVAKRIDTYSKKGVPAVRISLKNIGDRSLDKVKIIVYFQDENGNTIFEEDYHPVLVSDYSFRENNKPLKPGYVEEMEKDKYYTLETALTDWKEGKAIIKVVDIEFTK